MSSPNHSNVLLDTNRQCVCLTNFIWCSNSNSKCHVTFSKINKQMNVNRHLHFSLNVSSTPNFNFSSLSTRLLNFESSIALRMLTTVDLVYFTMCKDPAWIETHWNRIRLRTWSHMTSCYTWGPVTTLHDVRGVLGGPLDTFFWAIRILRSRLLARVWSGP